MATRKIKIPILLFTLAFLAGHFGLTSKAEAATIFLVAPGTQLKIGQTAEVTIRVDSEGQSFNAAEATIKFPKDILEIKSINYSSTASAFNFWLDEPKFSNQDGTVHFIGGATSGLDGAAIPLLKIIFNAKGNGEATISVTDAAITAADGSGANILSKIQPLFISISPTILTPLAPVAAPATSSTPQETSPAPVATVISLGPPPPPVQIVRKPAVTSTLPVKPTITVPIYSEQNIWHNVTTNFLARWNLLPDISQVATALNHDPNFTPSRSEGLFEEKVFPSLTDGIWFLHVRFKNNIGWSQTAHWRIALDTVPPAPFTIDSSVGLKTDSPQPTLSFVTSDGLSGIQNYTIQVDAGELVIQEGDSRTLPIQPPGKHTISVKAIDRAGNSTSQNIQLEIIPIVSPVIASFKQDIFVGEGNLTVGGTALANTFVMLKLKAESGAPIAETEATTNVSGSWQGVFENPLKKGHYFVEATTRDGRGALSLSVRSGMIGVRDRPLLVIAGIEITWIWVYVVSVFLLIGLIVWGYRLFKRWKNQAERRATIGQRDVVNFFTFTKENLEKLEDKLSDKTLNLAKIEETKFLAKRLRESTDKVEEYIVENIKEIPE